MPRTAPLPPPVGDRQTLLNNGFGLKPKPAAPALPPGSIVDEHGTWIPEQFIDDSPQQPRSTIHQHERAIIELMELIEGEGQLQPISVRVHPGDATRFQQIYGHRRKYCIRWGANGGPTGLSPTERKKYQGLVKCTIETAHLTDIQMLTRAIIENSGRQQPSIYDRGRSYLRLFEMFKKSSGLKNDMEIWTLVAEKTKIKYLQMTRLAYVAELPADWQKEFASKPEGEGLGDADADDFVLDGTHLKALQTLKKWPVAQRNLWNAIRREKWSGTQALKYATESSRQLRVKQPTLEQREEDAAIAEKRAAASAKVVAEQAAALAAGEAPGHLSLVGKSTNSICPSCATLREQPAEAATSGRSTQFQIGDWVAWDTNEGVRTGEIAEVRADGSFGVRAKWGGKITVAKFLAHEIRLAIFQKDAATPDVAASPPPSKPLDIADYPAPETRSREFRNIANGFDQIDKWIKYIREMALIGKFNSDELDAIEKQIRSSKFYLSDVMPCAKIAPNNPQ